MRAKHRNHHIIYKTTCIVTGRWYIGMHSTDDLDDGYIGSGKRLWRSIQKHGKEAHKFEVLESLPDRKALATREKELLTEELRADPLCMNIAPGGVGHHPGWYTTSPETGAKIAENNRRWWAKIKQDPTRLAQRNAKANTPEAIAKRAAANTGKTRTKEQVDNLVAGQQRYFATADQASLNARGQKAAATRAERGTNKGGRPKGIPTSEEHKQVLRAKMKGKSPLQIRASCLHCHKETTIVSLNRHHTDCSS